MTTPAEHHREVAGDFTRRVDATSDWDAPAPVGGWTARDVVGHLVDWFPAFLEGGTGIRLAAAPGLDRLDYRNGDPVAAWHAHTTAVQQLLDDPAYAGRVLSNPHLGEVPLPEAVDRFYTADVFLHTWDLARATGQDDTLDPETCARMLAGMEPMDEVLRASGQYGARVPVPEDADVQTRLIGFIGRDPQWRP